MPTTNSDEYGHSLVVNKNKLFVISKEEDGCEVFYSICKKFITIKSPKFDSFYSIRAFSIENKIFAFQEKSSKIIYYDTNKNECSEKFCEVTKYLANFAFDKIPLL